MFNTLILNDREEDYEHDPTSHIKFLKQRNHELQQYWIEKNKEVRKMWKEETDKLKKELLDNKIVIKMLKKKTKYLPKKDQKTHTIDAHSFQKSMKDLMRLSEENKELRETRDWYRKLDSDWEIEVKQLRVEVKQLREENKKLKEGK